MEMWTAHGLHADRTRGANIRVKQNQQRLNAYHAQSSLSTQILVIKRAMGTWIK